MEMIVHLHPDVFEIVKNKTKDIEVRVNDEKRRKLKIGDTLVFLKRPNDDEEIRAKVIGLEYYNYFDDLVENYDMERIYLSNYTKEEYLNEMKRFYTREDQEKYGVVAIIFSKE
ncbi:MAG: ASCH domain-containing protein [Candidatus Coprovivens sp.]